MKQVSYLLTVILLAFLSCNKHDDQPENTGNIFEADIDGKHWQADSAGAAFVYISPNYGGNFFRLAGSSSDGRSFHLTTKSEVPSEAVFKVTFGPFKAKFDVPNSNGIVLSWTTLDEADADKFEIERSYDAITFIKVGEVEATGNSSATISYEWHDKPSFDDRYYYRLKCINTDGTYQFAPVLVIGNSLTQYYFSSASDIAYHYGFDGNVTVTSNDTAAKRVTGTFQFDYVDDGTGTKHTVRNGKFTSLAY